ncbi:MAG: lysophospholipid acyltransferase family protein [Bacteroidota bacterium]
MKKLFSYLFTPIFLPVFGLLLVVFDPVQRLMYWVGDQKWQQKVVVFLNLLLTRSLLLMGIHCKFRNEQSLPTDRPLIIVSNHQSMFDIPPFFWYLRKHSVKFVSKIELAKGIPSISFNLRKGGNAIIDRKDPDQAIPALTQFARYIEKNRFSACIFPEGTRSRTGHPKTFSLKGLATLLEHAPNALVVPVSINNCWKIMRHGWFPLSFGEKPTWRVHSPIEPAGKTAVDVLREVEQVIVAGIQI